MTLRNVSAIPIVESINEKFEAKCWNSIAKKCECTKNNYTLAYSSLPIWIRKVH